jgi:hypothetical protein
MVQDYSDYVKGISDVGTYRTVIDVLSATQGDPGVKFDSGLLSSNGYRYSYLRNRVANVVTCNTEYPNGITYGYVPTCTSAGFKIVTYSAPKNPVTRAYVGNDVVLSQV